MSILSLLTPESSNTIVLSKQFNKTWLEDNRSIPRITSIWLRGKKIRSIKNFLQEISIGQLKHKSKFLPRDHHSKKTKNLSFFTHEQDINEWIAPETNSTSKGIPLMKHLPRIRYLDFEASVPLKVKNLPVALGSPVWSFRLPPFCSFLGYGQSLCI